MIKVIEKVKVKINLKKTRLKKFDKKIEAEIKLTQSTNLTARICSIQV